MHVSSFCSIRKKKSLGFFVFCIFGLFSWDFFYFKKLLLENRIFVSLMMMFYFIKILFRKNFKFRTISFFVVVAGVVKLRKGEKNGVEKCNNSLFLFCVFFFSLFCFVLLEKKENKRFVKSVVVWHKPLNKLIKRKIVFLLQ